jgi:hypothetical protein
VPNYADLPSRRGVTPALSVQPAKNELLVGHCNTSLAQLIIVFAFFPRAAIPLDILCISDRAQLRGRYQMPTMNATDRKPLKTRPASMFVIQRIFRLSS